MCEDERKKVAFSDPIEAKTAGNRQQQSFWREERNGLLPVGVLEVELGADFEFCF
ncbi:unnamed protein product [Meloidogyne enterolobii]|uniref:Uncharacterized protein n=1 Tax=Meloidogyne enterolobii TaxID=390850 RepID=A0ACB0ZDH2_MELEN